MELGEVNKMEQPDAVHEEGGKWWFLTENWADKCGPYDTKVMAQIELDRYCRVVLNGETK